MQAVPRLDPDRRGHVVDPRGRPGGRGQRRGRRWSRPFGYGRKIGYRRQPRRTGPELLDRSRAARRVPRVGLRGPAQRRALGQRPWRLGLPSQRVARLEPAAAGTAPGRRTRAGTLPELVRVGRRRAVWHVGPPARVRPPDRWTLGLARWRWRRRERQRRLRLFLASVLFGALGLFFALARFGRGVRPRHRDRPGRGGWSGRGGRRLRLLRRGSRGRRRGRLRRRGWLGWRGWLGCLGWRGCLDRCRRLERCCWLDRHGGFRGWLDRRGGLRGGAGLGRDALPAR
jgi:hypothetical protein